jgi:ribosomal protein S18 acetylase RimI-like enzyme
MPAAGFEIRQATLDDAGDIARVKIQGWHEAYTGIVPDSVLASLDHEDHTRRWRQIIELNAENTARFVAEVPVVGIVGFADCGPLRYAGEAKAGEITAIYVLASAQRRGVGRGLMSAAAGALKSFGMTDLTAWVLSDNQPARRFYEALGGVQTKEMTVTIGRELSEVAYFWEDVGAL